MLSLLNNFFCKLKKKILSHLNHLKSNFIKDFFIIDTATTNGFVIIPAPKLALVTFNGLVYIVFHLSEMRTRCKLSIKYFPFDTQVKFKNDY